MAHTPSDQPAASGTPRDQIRVPESTGDHVAYQALQRFQDQVTDLRLVAGGQQTPFGAGAERPLTPGVKPEQDGRVRLAFNGLPESDATPFKLPPAPHVDRFPSETAYRDAYGQYQLDKDMYTRSGNPNPETAALAAVGPQFDQALVQSQREWGHAMLTVAHDLGLTNTTQITDAAKRFNSSLAAVEQYTTGMTDGQRNSTLGTLKQYLSVDRNSPAAREMLAQLPPGMADAARGLQNAASDPIYRDYVATVGPTVVNRLMLLDNYSQVLGAAGMTDKQRQIKQQYTDLMNNS